jgi:hypothetical protein
VVMVETVMTNARRYELEAKKNIGYIVSGPPDNGVSHRRALEALDALVELFEKETKLQRAIADGFSVALMEAERELDKRKGQNLPIPYTYRDVATILRDMADRVESGDSFEGSMEYALPDVPEWAQKGEARPEGWKDPEVLFRCQYRIGNSMGQGGIRIVGSINEDQKAAPHQHQQKPKG